MTNVNRAYVVVMSHSRAHAHRELVHKLLAHAKGAFQGDVAKGDESLLLVVAEDLDAALRAALSRRFVHGDRSTSTGNFTIPPHAALSCANRAGVIVGNERFSTRVGAGPEA